MLGVIVLTALLTVTQGGQVSVNQNLTQEQCAKLRERLQCNISRDCYFDGDKKVDIHHDGAWATYVSPGDVKSAECVN